MTLSSTTNAPSPTGGQVWAVTLNDAATGNTYEIVYVTARTGPVCTIIRGQEGTAATTWLANDLAYADSTAGILNNFALINGNAAQNFAAAALSVASTASTGPLTASSLTTSAVAFTATGVASQAADIADFTLTPGGIKSIWIDKNGVLNLASNGLGGAGLVNGPAIGVGTAGNLLINTTSGALLSFTSGTGGSTQLGQFSNTGVLVVGATNLNGNESAGDIALGRTGSTAFMFFGTSITTAGQMDFGATNAGGYSYKVDPSVPAYAPLYASAFTISSDAKFKENVLAIQYGLDTIKALKPSSFTWIRDKKKDLGFIAQDVQAIMPEAVSIDNEGNLGLTTTGITAALVLSVQQLAAKVEALESTSK
jgi:hypothetical protein